MNPSRAADPATKADKSVDQIHNVFMRRWRVSKPFAAMASSRDDQRFERATSQQPSVGKWIGLGFIQSE